jgi:hypothetical protein
MGLKLSFAFVKFEFPGSVYDPLAQGTVHELRSNRIEFETDGVFILGFIKLGREIMGCPIQIGGASSNPIIDFPNCVDPYIPHTADFP